MRSLSPGAVATIALWKSAPMTPITLMHVLRCQSVSFTCEVVLGLHSYFRHSLLFLTAFALFVFVNVDVNEHFNVARIAKTITKSAKAQ